MVHAPDCEVQSAHLNKEFREIGGGYAAAASQARAVQRETLAPTALDGLESAGLVGSAPPVVMDWLSPEKWGGGVHST